MVGENRPRQERLGWWDRFQVADGWVASSARALVAATVVGAVIFVGAQLAFHTGSANAAYEPSAYAPSNQYPPPPAYPRAAPYSEPAKPELDAASAEQMLDAAIPQVGATAVQSSVEPTVTAAEPLNEIDAQQENDAQPVEPAPTEPLTAPQQ